MSTPLRVLRSRLRRVGPLFLTKGIMFSDGGSGSDIGLRTTRDQCVPAWSAQVELGCGPVSVDQIYRAGARGAPCWARSHRGQIRELPMPRWLGTAASRGADRVADEHILALCATEPTLDLGCGPGRFTAALHRSGSAALGVDICESAVEMTRRRGGAAIRRDTFGPLPAEGRWERVLLADGNIGMGGDPIRTLRRAAHMLAPSGRVVAEVDAPSTAVVRELVRWETRHHRGPWFPWARVGARALGELAHAAGLVVTDVAEVHGRFIVTLAHRARS